MHRTDSEVIRLLLSRFVSGDTAYSNFSSIYTGSQYIPFYEKTREYLSSGSLVLDWGCGNGHASAFLTSSGYEVTGFSFDEYYFQAIVSGRFQFRSGSATDPVRLPFPDGSFDAVVSVGVLEHVRETGGSEVESLKEIRRVLRPGGHFLCCHLPNKYSWIEAATGMLGGSLHHHEFRYTKGDVRRLCRGARLRLVHLHSYGVLPRTLIARFLTLRVRRSVAFASVLNRVDSALSRFFSPLAQNFLFVARKNQTSE